MVFEQNKMIQYTYLYVRCGNVGQILFFLSKDRFIFLKLDNMTKCISPFPIHSQLANIHVLYNYIFCVHSFLLANNFAMKETIAFVDLDIADTKFALQIPVEDIRFTCL